MVIKPLISFLGILGGTIFFIGLILLQFEPQQLWTIVFLNILALLCLVVYLMANWKRLKTFSSRRSTKLRFNSMFSILLLAGVLIILNILVIRHGGRFDLSETRKFSLAPQTFQVLNNLKQDVQINVFTHKNSPGFLTYRDLLESYAHASPYIKFKFIDPEKEPNHARKLGITKIDIAVFQSGFQTIHVSKPTEMNLTSALIRVNKDKKKRIIFLKGHNERRANDTDKSGLSFLKNSLIRQGYEVESTTLMNSSTNSLKDIDVLAIVGPQNKISRTEALIISDFLQNNGQLLLLIDPQIASGLEPVMENLGITLGPGILVDPKDRVAQGSPMALLVRRFSTNHPITKGLKAPIYIPVLQPVVFSKSQASNWTFTSLAESSEQSWAETDFTQNQPKFEKKEDRKGPFTLAAALTQQFEKDKTSERPSVVIIGNSAFASNAYARFPGNTDFLLNTIAWLAMEDTLVSMAAKNPAFEPFIPNPTQEHLLLAIQVFSVPLLLLFLGITIWRRRQH